MGRWQALKSIFDRTSLQEGTKSRLLDYSGEQDAHEIVRSHGDIALGDARRKWSRAVGDQRA